MQEQIKKQEEGRKKKGKEDKKWWCVQTPKSPKYDKILK